jgi:3-phosphoshikimate 1-carboxyvinyltransferase
LSASIILKQQQKIKGIPLLLPSSKSISNRALILHALSGNQSQLHNLSSARDTALMRALVSSSDEFINVLDAGTTMRFLTAYFAITNQHKTLTGTERMKQRPIQLLVNALREIGATIDYLEQDGFPPIKVKGFEKQKANTVQIPGNVSSQYISALMMVAPQLPNGLTIELTGSMGSWPYIKMTASLMKSFGLPCDFQPQKIIIPQGKYTPTEITIEADWSAASYWFAFVALAEDAHITLNNVSMHSLQGDRVIVEAMEKLGVKSVRENNSLILTKQPHQASIEWDFTDCPDLAQTILPVCAAKNITGTFVGLESLRIKETDRIAALQNELGKIGAKLAELETGNWQLLPGKLSHQPIKFHTYHDHRMAMGFAPLAALIDVSFDDFTVVNKSYPGFWEDCRSVGIETIST